MQVRKLGEESRPKWWVGFEEESKK